VVGAGVGAAACDCTWVGSGGAAVGAAVAEESGDAESVLVGLGDGRRGGV